eukprot:CAMPEP_0168770486 /NCGR_PEP_ID=MMETSP0725-20121227/2944_1 /TAXON_ID=265536 /ORGANISM="Amphiprora sp., Strain CCMP467" /LENGTH=286 /DNA_ID=CAMNT_0008819931 /DNA_START=174 /DNA_END=1034 /DNA_ORIENTATION=+
MTKPKSPLSAYNLFFQLVRKRILDCTDQENRPITLPELADLAAKHKRRGKRVHRKTHGIISFGDLAKAVAKRWKALNPSDRAVLNHQVELEKIEHAQLLQAYCFHLEKEMEEKKEIEAIEQLHQSPCNLRDLSWLSGLLESLGNQNLQQPEEQYQLDQLLEPTPLREGIEMLRGQEDALNFPRNDGLAFVPSTGNIPQLLGGEEAPTFPGPVISLHRHASSGTATTAGVVSEEPLFAVSASASARGSSLSEISLNPQNVELSMPGALYLEHDAVQEDFTASSVFSP